MKRLTFSLFEGCSYQASIFLPVMIKRNFRPEGASWIRGTMFPLYLRYTILTLGLLEFKPRFKLLLKRILRLYQSQISRRNLRFVFTYLKEAYTVALFKRMGQSYTPKVRVSIDTLGYPRIVPYQLRILLDSRRDVFVGVLTLLGVHRVIP